LTADDGFDQGGTARGARSAPRLRPAGRAAADRLADLLSLTLVDRPEPRSPAALLPRLRTDLDFFPSPVPDRPGLLIRDPYGFSEATLIIPPTLARCLGCFDGRSSGLDLRARLARLTGTVAVAEIADRLIDALAEAGMLHDETYARAKATRERAFTEAPVRAAAHAGAAYPADRPRIDRTLAGYLAGCASDETPLLGIAAPHVSPEGGPRCYGAAYGALSPELAERTFVILGTSHYGEPNRFGLTRKPFTTPLGRAETDGALVSALERDGGAGAKMEDYCHAIEHSIEFQVLFLQHRYGPGVRILPILCGPLVGEAGPGSPPEGSDDAARFIAALGELGAREGQRLFWVLGVDMTHTGRRYGDPSSARAEEGPLLAVTERDHDRIERIAAGDAAGFWEMVHELQHDDLKWCGTSPLYTFLRAVPQARGRLLRYDQWNIDPDSVVSFAAMAFH
jgi:AmmeMemoRadiSam system protein B